MNAGKQCVELTHQIEYINLQTYFTLNMIIGSDKYSCSRYSVRTKHYYFAVDYNTCSYLSYIQDVYDISRLHTFYSLASLIPSPKIHQMSAVFNPKLFFLAAIAIVSLKRLFCDQTDGFLQD